MLKLTRMPIGAELLSGMTIYMSIWIFPARQETSIILHSSL